MRIAHCSDLHLLSLEGARILDFANKRWIGGLNLLTSRGRHYHTVAFEDMVADLNASDVDHIICTGDITNLALEQEFVYARTRFDGLRLGAREVTVLPGNHDSYIAKGAEYYAAIFAPYFASDEGWAWDDADPWPIVRVRGDVAIVGLSTSLRTPWFTAWGRVGDKQLGRLRSALADPRLEGKVRFVAIHHPPAGPHSLSRIRGLRDHKALHAVLAEVGAEIVIHGHEHQDLVNEIAGPNRGRAEPVIEVRGVPSGTYEAQRPERTARYRIFEIAAGRIVGHHLRVWDSASHTFRDDTTQSYHRAPAPVAASHA
jgi:3',5'-cyclic AMP phosphodiesterase CpdA